MASLTYKWRIGDACYETSFVWVPGTVGRPYLFGRDPNRRAINVRSFYLGATPVTQSLWLHVMGTNPALHQDLQSPVENISWEQIN
jgi:formylglycine-generating enzyme required for sulfatase activity